MGEAACRAQLGDARCLSGTPGAQAVIDRGDLEAIGNRRLREQQQRETVGSARDREAEAALDERARAEVGGEARRRFG